MCKRSATILIILLSLLTVGAACGTQDDASPEAVTANGAEITQRQQDMLDITEQFMAAWAATDGDAVASFMTPDAYLAYPDLKQVFRVKDGTLQERVSNGPHYSTIVVHTPAIVYGHRIVLMGRVEALGLDWLSVIRFTATGDLQIMSQTLYH